MKANPNGPARKVEIVEIGDRIRFSVALLRHLYEMPEYESVLVEVAAIKIAPDGAKVLILNSREEL